jgi:hypothetical protein
MASVHADERDGARAATLGARADGLLRERRELIQAHLACGHRELAVLDLAQAAVVGGGLSTTMGRFRLVSNGTHNIRSVADYHRPRADGTVNGDSLQQAAANRRDVGSRERGRQELGLWRKAKALGQEA